MTISDKIKHALEVDGVAILPPMDGFTILKFKKDKLQKSLSFLLFDLFPTSINRHA